MLRALPGSGFTGVEMLTASADRTLRLWKVDEEIQLLFQGHKAAVDCATLLHAESFVSGAQVRHRRARAVATLPHPSR